jgi:hypothetical protein
MPYEVVVGDNMATSLDEIAALLPRLRDLLIDVPARYGGWVPKEDSRVSRDLATRLVDDDLMNKMLLDHSRTLGSLYARVGADYLAGMAALFREREAVFAPGALARAAFECGTQGVAILDQRLDVETRAARALLHEIVSAYRMRDAHRKLSGKSDESYLIVDHRWKELKKRALESFPHGTSFADDSGKWTVGGERYLSPSEAADYWAEWRSDIASDESASLARTMYDLLCLHSHPQSFASRPEATWDADGLNPKLSTDLDIVARIVSWSHAPVFDAVNLLFGYHGWAAPELEALAQGINSWPASPGSPPTPAEA